MGRIVYKGVIYSAINLPARQHGAPDARRWFGDSALCLRCVRSVDGGRERDTLWLQRAMGYDTDSETGLLLLTYRYLDPTTGRFLTRDPIGCEGGINLYAYVGNGVVTDKDPFGLTVQFCTRPVVCDWARGPRACHWFLTSSQCGCIGYGNQGVFFNCKDHYGDYKPSCKTVPTTPAQERCLCDLANNASRGWVMCGEKWLPKGKGKGGYDSSSHNCQYFVICLAKKCGLKYNFPGPLRPYQPHIW